MLTLLRFAALVVLLLTGSLAWAADPSLLPKYGGMPKTEAQLAADARFLAEIDKASGGDRKGASRQVVAGGWQALRANKPVEAMRRFNQAWLLDSKNGSALWGMAAMQGMNREAAQSLALFQEAEPLMNGDVDFAADHARTVGMLAVESRDEALVAQAMSRFAAVHQQAPQHTLNLQNWAVTLFKMGRHADAWAKVALAEATPRAKELDPAFITALQEKMPRPAAN